MNVDRLLSSGNPRADAHGFLDEIIASARELRPYDSKRASQKASWYAALDRNSAAEPNLVRQRQYR
jgi:hypothetical protein